MVIHSQKSIQVQAFLPQLVAGLLLGLMLTTDAIAVGLILFSGTSMGLLPIGINLALFSATIATLFITFSSSFPITGVVPSFETAAIVATVVAATFSNLAEPAAVPTILATIGISSILTGGLLFTIGRFRLSRMLRYMPYPVLCGFLGSTGWLVIQGAVSISLGETEGTVQWSQLWQGTMGLQILAAIAFAGVLLWCDRRFTQFWVKPCLLVGAILSSHLLLALSQVPLSDAVQQGWFLAPLEAMQVGQAANLLTVFQIDWIYLLEHSSNLASILVIVPLVIILELTGLEIVLKRDIHIDHELKINGIVNVILGLCGSPICHYDLTNTLINQKAGATSRLAGVVTAIFVGAILLIGGGLLVYLPTFIVVALTLVVGVSLLIEWLYNSRSQLPWVEYGLVLLIFAVVVIFGLLPGIGIGILAACVLFVINYSRLSGVRSTHSGQSHQSRCGRSFNQQKLLYAEGDQIYIVRLQGYIFFGTADALLSHIHHRLRASNRAILKFLVIDFRLVTGLDSSAILSLQKLKELAQRQEFNLIFTHVQSAIQQQLERSYIESEDETLKLFIDLDRGLEWCENEILSAVSWRRQQSLPLALQLGKLFSNVDHASVVMNYLEKLDVEAGQVLFNQNAPADALYFIETGQVAVFLELEPGNSYCLQTLGTGHPVGEVSFFLEAPHHTFAVVNKPGLLYCLSFNTWQRLKQDHPEAATAFQTWMLRLLSERLSAADREVADFST